LGAAIEENAAGLKRIVEKFKQLAFVGGKFK
jgi:hypothetical protein